MVPLSLTKFLSLWYSVLVVLGRDYCLGEKLLHTLAPRLEYYQTLQV